MANKMVSTTRSRVITASLKLGETISPIEKEAQRRRNFVYIPGLPGQDVLLEAMLHSGGK